MGLLGLDIHSPLRMFEDLFLRTREADPKPTPTTSPIKGKKEKK